MPDMAIKKETEHLLKCSDARTNGDPVCRSLVIRREPMEENILGLVHQYAASMLEKEKKWLEEKYTNDNNALVERLNAEKENNKILAGKLDAAYAQIRDIATQTVQANGAIRIMETNSSKN